MLYLNEQETLGTCIQKAKDTLTGISHNCLDHVKNKC